MLMTTLMIGLVLGGTYSLAALGMTMQYGVARIMNLAYGELMITASFATFVLFSTFEINPLLALPAVATGGFILSYVIYGLLMSPLAKRASDAGALEVDSILVTFGLLFLLQGILLVIFGADFTSYTFLNTPVEIFGVVLAANRLIALVAAVVLGGGLYLFINNSRWGRNLRAVATNPENAPLVGIDLERTARTAFAVGGMLAALAGVIVSMFQTFTATAGVIFTMKALIVVIMGGVGNFMGALLSGLILGLVEALVSSYIDPGLTLAAVYLIFLVILLWRPQGLYGKG
ncbi:branched-chain amino acid ABC transporter permease [Sneathiella sp. P13V-1]|uniref:branched-chain amino acid ABC transporter permease n=1 Tax=Sneathiella sp. P13V-1 TaxID=2697366 RepID=UPI00187BA6D4|nr:branched-chain amino acid ABC transporter permease [Sneathiella sp. P13V-1]MBE7637479.1 branched-chain amino acid ABC transporter permease [Sneathiella sp. P13V-1]